MLRTFGDDWYGQVPRLVQRERLGVSRLVFHGDSTKTTGRLIAVRRTGSGSRRDKVSVQDVDIADYVTNGRMCTDAV